MLRLTGLAVAGAIPGALVTWYVLSGGDAQTGAGPEPLYKTQAEARSEPDTATSSTRLAVYTAAAGIDDAVDIESRLAALLGQAYSRENRIEIEILFARLAALDLGSALRIAARPGFDAGLVADVFRSWAERDPDSAMSVLGAIGNQSVRMAAALAVAEALGNNTAIIERIASLLPASDSTRFQAQALERLAKTDPNRALGQALTLGEAAARNTAVQRVAIEWVNRNPEAAMAQAESLPAELRDGYRDTVGTEWARVHTDSYMDFLDRQDDLAPQLLGLGHAMTYDPERLFEIAQTHNAIAYYGLGTLETVTFNVVAQIDLERAMDYLDAVDNPARAASLTTVLARTYGRENPDEAVAWARSFNPPRPELEAAVIGQIAAVDLDKSLRLIREFESGAETPANPFSNASVQGIAQYIGNFAANDPRREEIANGLVARSEDPSARMVLQQVTGRWVQTDPIGALDWMLENEAAIDPVIVNNISQALAVRDPRVAAGYMDRIPADMRRSWMQQVAAPYARVDPEGAAAWMAQFQGEPGYDSVVSQVVSQTAQTNPIAAATMLASAPSQVQQESAGNVASGWARQDLPAAARWATQLGDDSARTAAVNSVANTWAQRDPRAAQRWVANLPEGAARERALSTVLGNVLAQGADIQDSLVDAFDSTEQMQQEFSAQIARVANRNPDRAEELLNTWVSEPELRATPERMIREARQRYGL